MLSQPGPATTYPPAGRIDMRGWLSRVLGARTSVAGSVLPGPSRLDPTPPRGPDGDPRRRRDWPVNLRTLNGRGNRRVWLDMRGAVR